MDLAPNDGAHGPREPNEDMAVLEPEESDNR
jgi:hypothetical protein